MARPKSVNPKSKIISVRLTEDQYMKIMKRYGSVQKLVNHILALIGLVLLVSCNGGGASSTPTAPVEVPAPTTTETPTVAPTVSTSSTGFVANIAPEHAPHESGYALSYSCTDSGNDCQISSGKFYFYYLEVYTSGHRAHQYFQITTSDLRKVGANIYQGNMCNSYGNCTELRLNLAEKKAAITDGTNCMKKENYSNGTTISEVEAFYASIKDSHTGGEMLTADIRGSTAKSLCGF